MKRKIGIVDSKIGGFYLLKELQSKFKYEDLIYFDVKYFDSILERDLETEINELLSFILSHDLKLLIISSDFISSLINEFEIMIPIPYLLTTDSLIDYTNENYEQKIMLFLSKERVFETSVYPKNLKADQLFSVISDELSLLPEQDEIKTSRSFRQVINSLEQFSNKHVDVLVSGCSNISLLTTEIIEVLPNVEIISLFEVLINKTKQLLVNLGLENKKGRGKTFIVSENDKRTVKTKVKNLQLKVKRLINVEKLL